MYEASVTYDGANRLILIVLAGTVDYSALAGSRTVAARLAKKHGCFRVLVDMTAATSTLSEADIRAAPQVASHVLAAQGLDVSKFKRALLVGAEFAPDPYLFESAALNRDHAVKLFSNRAEALAWLSE